MRKKRYRPEEIISKLREADILLAFLLQLERYFVH